MIVILGLGNPGKEYEGTRHNAGYMFIESLWDFLGWDRYYDASDWTSYKDSYKECKVKSGSDVKAILAKPLTFMNSSGRAAKDLANKYDLKVSEEFILVHDDLDIEFGKFKIQRGVSPKDHKGVRSVENSITSKDFLRVRIGVDNREGDRSIPGEEYVLKKMKADEKKILDEVIADASRQLRDVVGF